MRFESPADQIIKDLLESDYMRRLNEVGERRLANEANRLKYPAYYYGHLPRLNLDDHCKSARLNNQRILGKLTGDKHVESGKWIKIQKLGASTVGKNKTQVGSSFQSEMAKRRNAVIRTCEFCGLQGKAGGFSKHYKKCATFHNSTVID